MFLPGNYNVDFPIRFYTQVLGLGASPDNVQIKGNVHADANVEDNNATTTFWRAAEGFSVTPYQRYHAVGRFTGGSLPPYARTRQYRSSSERRMGARRLDVRYPR
jgi:hypothetical protein